MALSEYNPNSVVVHASSSIDGRKDANAFDISRKRGLIGGADREKSRFPQAVHHFKIFFNKDGKARLIYRHDDENLNIRYIKWERKLVQSAS